MLARYAFLAVIAFGFLAAAFTLAPGDLERLAMLERDGRHEQAMEELQQLYDAGERNPRLTLRLYDLKIRFGILDQAQTILEDYAKRRPTDVEAQIGLVRFYQSNQLEQPYLNALRTLQERTRSRELLTELLSYYRMAGRFRDEEELLERTARANRAAPADFERLGLLASARGDLQRAARALRRADGRLDEQSRSARIGLFRTLLALKETDEAHQRCVVWLRSWRDSELAVEFMDALSQAGRIDLALDIGGRFGGPGNDTTLVSAELLHEQGRHGEALVRLREYQGGGLPEVPDRIQRFVATAAATSGTDMALAAARTLGLRKMEASIIVDLLDAINDALETGTPAMSPVALKGFAGEIDARVQNAAPVGQEATDRLVLPDDLRLFATYLALQDKDREVARRFLASIDPDRLSSSDLSRWSELQVASGLRATAFPNLPRTWQRRDRSELVARRLPRPDRALPPVYVPPALRPGDGPGRPLQPSASTPPRDTVQALAAQDNAAAKARRARRQANALERRRQRARISAQRQQQQPPGPAQPLFVPKPQAVPTPLPPSGG